MQGDIYSEEFDRLPRWAQIALAARCAHRVVPLFAFAPSNVYLKYSDILWRAVRSVEAAASNADASMANTDLIPQLKGAYDDAQRGGSATNPAAESAVRVPGSLIKALNAAAGGRGGGLDAISDAVVAAAYNNDYGPTWPRTLTAAAIRQDFEDLVRAAKQNKWTDQSPVDQSCFRSMWPTGKPKGWPNY